MFYDSEGDNIDEDDTLAASALVTALKVGLHIGPRLVVLDVQELSHNSFMASRIDPEQRAAHRRVVECLRFAGCDVRRTQIPEMAEAFDVWSALMTASNEIDFWDAVTEGHPAVATTTNSGTTMPPSKLAEAARFLLGRSNFTLPGIGLAIIEDVISNFPGHQQALLRKAQRLRQVLAKLLGGSTVRACCVRACVLCCACVWACARPAVHDWPMLSCVHQQTSTTAHSHVVWFLCARTYVCFVCLHDGTLTMFGTALTPVK